MIFWGTVFSTRGSHFFLQINCNLSGTRGDAVLHLFWKKGGAKKLPEKKAKIAPILSFETVLIYIKIHLLSCCKFI